MAVTGIGLMSALGMGMYATLEALDQEYVDYLPQADLKTVQANYAGWQAAVTNSRSA